MEESANRGVFLNLVTYTADLDGAFRDHFEKYVVKNTLTSIQNDLLSCMLKVYTSDGEPMAREIINTGTRRTLELYI